MEQSVKKYTHIARGEGVKREEDVFPESKIKSLVKDGIEFEILSELVYTETEFQSLDEFSKDTNVPDDVKIDIVNRGWTLLQQQTARQLCAADDAEFVNTTEPVDITKAAVAPRERRKPTPERGARNYLGILAKQDPAMLAQILAEFQSAGEVGASRG